MWPLGQGSVHATVLAQLRPHPECWAQFWVPSWRKGAWHPLPCPKSPLLPLPRYFFPRQLLIRHFWTPSQQLEFLDAYARTRRDSYPDVLWGLALAAGSLPEPQPRELLQQLCAQVWLDNPSPVLEGLDMSQVLSLSPQRALSQVLFLTPYLPSFLLRHRLRSHVLEIQHLDRALLHLGLAQLSEEELRAACYLRGLNSTHLGQAECRAWLEQWLRLSCELQASEASLLAHSMVLLSLNYSQPPE
uniref:Letm1 RBD domain-containing protein n=1 Tax=Catharus ustulatus TaxID=91951 RepID=A0A8C3UUY1_CATUS